MKRLLPTFDILIWTPFAPAQWAAQPSGTTARLRGLSVANADVAWASGTGGTVLRTTDGGTTWKAMMVPGASSLDFRDVEAFDDKTAYLLSIGEGETSRIYKTTDGGATWEFVYKNRDPKGFLDALAFWDAEHGLALGDPVDGHFVILRTEDAGKNWIKVPPRWMPEVQTGEGAFAASGTCLVVGEDGHAWFATGGAKVARVFRSTDRGRTWTAYETPVVAGSPSAGIFSLAFHDADHGIAVGGDYKEPGKAENLVALTSDGGRTWRLSKGAGPGGYRSSVAYVPTMQGRTLVAVGPTGSDISEDGGETWRPLGATGFNNVQVAGPTAGWAVGDDGLVARFDGGGSEERWAWATASPESQGMDPEALNAAWAALEDRHTTALLVVRHDRIVFDRYAPGFDRHKPHYTASMAKALVVGLGLMLSMDDDRIEPDDPAWRYVPQWRDDPQRKAITIRHLATHTSGIEDAEEDGLPHDRLTGWKGDFWKRLPPPHDPFTLARDRAPVLEEPGTRERYSNPGMAMLGHCVTASLRGTDDPDLRSLLKHRVMEPLGVPDAEWSVGYGTTTTVDGLPLVATWVGGSYSPDAVARVGRLLVRKGDWEGRRVIDPDVVGAALKPGGMPGHSGLGWWVNRGSDGTKLWESAPEDAFGGAGAGQQFLLVVPGLDLIVVRNGGDLDPGLGFEAGLDRYVVAPVIRAVTAGRTPPCSPSPVIKEVRWAPVESIRRKARGSDNWPLTWGDDDALYTAYGDGRGFEPFVPEKLSLGLARVVGTPEDFEGENIRSATGEQTGDGAEGRKASGLLMVDGVLYLWARNADNSQLAWSSDHARTWTWCDWRFETGFGCPTFLNFGKDYAGARDEYVYVYSPDSDGAYEAADRMVLARVPKGRIAERRAYEFFGGLGDGGEPLWAADIALRTAVFHHPGGCGRSTISYDAGLGRYLWCQTVPGGDARFRGGFGIYDAPEPWGPWTTAYFIEGWDVGPGETCGLPTRWMSADGRAVYLVFSGDDCFSVRKADLIVGE